MSVARGSTAPPSEAGSYMTAMSEATVQQRVLTQAQQRIAELEQELAKAKAPAAVNTAAAFPFGNFGNFGYNVEYCSELEDTLRSLAVTSSSAKPADPLRPLAVTSSFAGPADPLRPLAATSSPATSGASSKSALRHKTTYKDAASHVSFSSDVPAVNAVSRHLVSFVPNLELTAQALAEKEMYQPTLPIKAAFDTSTVAWDKVLPRLQDICRVIAVTKGGRTRSTPAEDQLIQVMTEFNLLGNNIALQAEALAAPAHLANKRMTLAFFDNNDAASGVTTYGKDGQPQLRKRILVDCGANVLCINRDVANDCPLPMLSCSAHIKTFGDNKVSVIGKILDYPMTFCRGTEWEVTVRCTALVYSTGTTWEILAGMPVVNHYAVNLWPCAFLGGIVMFPRLANSNYEDILALPPAQRCKHLGAMVILPVVMTEYDNG